jgi:hypothetical protein
MKGSTKIKILLSVVVITMLVNLLPTYIMMLPWDDENFIEKTLAVWGVLELLALVVAGVSAEFYKQWDSEFWLKWFSITAWLVVGIRLLWKHVVELADKHLTD